MVQRLTVSDHNELTHFPAEASEPLRSLQSLELASNRLKNFDISTFPEIRILRLDKNSIVRVDNPHKAKHLETLSMREQTLDLEPKTDHVRIDGCLDIRHLYLSGNILPTLAPKADFLNLQHLELASSGIQTLPPEFGQKIANTRSLNLNFNALKDIRPLLGIIRLTRLSLAGNRLSRLRRTTAVLARFRTLQELDLRNNPLTLGFYPPPSTSTESHLVTTHTDNKNRNPDTEDIPASPYDLAPATKTTDTPYRERLDADTKLRRRVYKMLFASGTTLTKLDGLDFERGQVGRRDWVWERLVEIGVVRLQEREVEEKDEEADEEERGQDEMGSEEQE